LVGNYVLSAGHAGKYYENAKKVLQSIRYEFMNTFEHVDLIVMPTHPMPAFAFGAYDVNKLQMDLQDYFTCSVNLAGLPAISLPCGLTRQKLPIGFQLIGNHLAEDLLLQIAHAYEQKTEWHTLRPAGF
jgi:aspartyl-tRNA(Asn)/glutamyl-tRNA(Gln) amidotransferase subunit A